MPQVPLQLPVSSQPGRYGADGATRLINATVEHMGRNGKIPFPIYATDGLSLKVTLGNGGPMRGMVVVGPNMYVNAANSIYKVDSNFTATLLGGLAGSGPTFMVQNQKTTPQILVVGDGVSAIIENDVVSQITSPNLNAPNSAAFLNQYFITSAASGRFQWSALSEGATWGALDFKRAEYAADGLKRAFTRSGELLLFGDRTIEPYYNQTAGATFARSGSVIEQGCAAGATVSILEQTPVFVADDLSVRALSGYSTQRISNHAVVRSIRDADLNSLHAWSFAKDDHSYYVLSGNNFTWVYDATLKEWHERQSYGLTRWRAQYAVPFAGGIVCGDYDGGQIYQIDETVFDEGGTPYIWTVQFPINAYPHPINLKSLRLDVIPGVGLNSSDPALSDPQVMISTSRNGGKTFEDERKASLGAIGEYTKQVEEFKFGYSNEDGFVIRVSISAGVLRGLTGGSINYEILKA